MFRITLVAGFLIAALAMVSAEELYSDIHDDIDVMGILENPEVRRKYYECFMDLGPCLTEDAKFFKGHFPDAVASHCRRCTDKQREHFDTVAVWYTENEPEEWKSLIAKGIADAHAGK
ncbi:ejaculatory bulb-specific protein 3-like [Diprion similis]|uniref:ejaculatory bulb-specific protein 3-like n=1 Tax=Diprion similis TaxID=362088 RepID=UPI001EF99AAA|nr:ejaculatory bulb-specific protein 3-like [Diprion similis]